MAVMRGQSGTRRRATVLLMIVGLLAMLFMIISAYLVLARYDRQTLTLSSQAQRVAEMVDSLNDIVSTGLRGRMAHLVIGADAADTPGFTQNLMAGPPDPNYPAVWGAAWLSAAEPVAAAGASEPNEVLLPYTASVGTAAIRPRWLEGLMLDVNRDGRVEYGPGYPDTIATVQQGFMDADGDGVPDADFAGSARLTELANAIAGRAVRAANIDPANLDDVADPNNALLWNLFESQARYVVAARVLSHGGMVQLAVPTVDYAPWNAGFTMSLFDWIRDPRDDEPLDLYDPRGHRAQVQALGASAASVEPLLRRRGGLLPAYREDMQILSGGIPQPLWSFEYVYPATLVPDYGRDKSGWQRFNLANPDLDEFAVWLRAASVNADDYNADPAPATLAGYARRQLLTTVNSSDELARLRSPVPRDPNNPYAQNDPNDPNWTGPGLRPGAMKYYLGKITDTRRARDVLGNGYTNTLLGAFKPDGTFNDSDEIAVGGRGIPQGFAVIAELRDYFYEMLADSDDWDSPTGEGVKLNQQAWMLAVNTVAFAAPRAPRETEKLHVDMVYVGPASFPPGFPYPPDKIYIGYAPQLYLTQVVAYNNPDPSGAKIALAVELYNPHESAVNHDLYDLQLDHFAITVGAGDPNDPNSMLSVAASEPRLPGRKFLLVAVNNNGGNTFFENYAQPQLYGYGRAPRPLPLGVPYVTEGSPIEVRLWRRGAHDAALWYLVDQLDVVTSDSASFPSNLPARERWYVNVARDTSFEPYFGRRNGNGDPARWRMVTAFRPEDARYHLVSRPARTTPGPEVIMSLGAGSANPADPLQVTETYHPCVPLHTMNPDLGATVYLNGAARPAAFPTVGFMLYVPRYSHTLVDPSDPNSAEPMGKALAEAWKRRPPADPNSIASVPVDFGHMPVFDNRQAVGSASHFEAGRAGKLPWGLFVFDYFTTINPDDGNGNGVPVEYDDADNRLDPYRIPGRVNINAAPWYLLAGLPVIGPESNGHLPLYESSDGGGTAVDPAFWNADLGILAGTGTGAEFGDRPRYPTTGDSGEILVQPEGSWSYRLGPYLAQALVAYRDRIPYVSGSASSPLYEAEYRNALSPYRPSYYGSLRGQADTIDPNDPAIGHARRGFLTLGELINVMAFDGSSAEDLRRAADGSGTVVGGYRDGVPDYMKAVSLLALLDTHFLTTRSNTYTVYLTIADREDPAASVRSQTTIDRTPMLPRLIWEDLNANGQKDPPGTSGDRYTVIPGNARPELVGQRQISYFNARYDE